VSPQESIIQWVYRLINEPMNTPFVDLMAKAIKDTTTFDAMTAQSAASANAKRYWNAIKKRSHEDTDLGRNPCLHCLNDTLFQYQGPVARLAALGRNKESTLLAARPIALTHLDGCNPREYEAAACVTLRLIGARETHLTPGGNEGGVDFYALLECDTHTHLFGNVHRALRIVGQSKKYASRESVTHFNAFVKALENVRHRHSTVQDHIPAWFGRGTGPVFGLFVAHQGLQSGAVDIAREHGIVLANSVDLSEMAAGSQTLSPTDPPAKRAADYLQLIKDEVVRYQL
jgi:hypothetical protein